MRVVGDLVLIDAVVKLFIGMMTGVLGMVPAYQPDGSFSDAGSSLGSTVGAINGVVPLTTIGVCLAAVIAARVFLLVWSSLVFIYDRIPLKFT